MTGRELLKLLQELDASNPVALDAEIITKHTEYSDPEDSVGGEILTLFDGIKLEKYYPNYPFRRLKEAQDGIRLMPKY